MPTYQECVDLINGNLANTSNIQAFEHRAVEKAILDYAKERIDDLGELEESLTLMADISIQLTDHHDEYPTGSGLNLSDVEFLSGIVNDSRYKINFTNPITGNYFVVLTNQSIGTLSNSWDNDNDIILTYRNPTENSIEVLLKEVGASIQNIAFHVSIIKYT